MKSIGAPTTRVSPLALNRNRQVKENETLTATKRSTAEQPITVAALSRHGATVTLIGQTPIIFNRMSEKARNTLLIGGKKKTAAERLELKHDPLNEFVQSMYIDENFHEDTVLKFPVVAFKSAMATAALVTPGMKKTDILRMVRLPAEFAPIFGIPRLRMDIVRSSDMARTPDVRTRSTVIDWATVFDVEFIKPQLSIHAITTLLNNAGIVVGVGENRQEKGKGSFGAFETAPSVPEHLLNLKDAQLEAISSPVPLNEDSAELLSEYAFEATRRA